MPLRMRDSPPSRQNQTAVSRMIALDLAVAALARLAMRAGDLLAAEILGPVEGDERSAAEPTERLAHHGFDQQLLDALEAGREQSRVRAVEHVGSAEDFPEILR